MNEYRMIVTNSYGESVDLWNDKEVAMTDIEGVSLEADVNTKDLSNMDGSSFVNSRLPERLISMVIRYRNEVIDAEKSKLRMYRIFIPKEVITLRYISPNQDKYITGYVSKCDTPPTAFPMVTQVSIKVPDPYWRTYDDHKTLLCGISPAFEFVKNNTDFSRVEFSFTKNSFLTGITYDGDTVSGITVVFEVKAPITMLGIRNVNRNQIMKVPAEFLEGDILTICTIPKHKSVTLLRNAVTEDYMVKISPGSGFPKIYPGENVIEVLLDGGTASSINVTCSYEILSGGI